MAALVNIEYYIEFRVRWSQPLTKAGGSYGPMELVTQSLSELSTKIMELIAADLTFETKARTVQYGSWRDVSK